MKTFKTRLTAHGPGGKWTYLHIPFDVEQTFGSKARIPVAGTINGYAFENSLMPNGDGTHSMMVSKALQGGAKAGAGDLVTVIIDVDRSERVVPVPPELAQALATEPAADAAFQKLSTSHRREFAEWVASAKRPETRVSRAAKALPLVLAKKHVR